MKTLKITTLLASLLLVLSFTACKKNNNTDGPEQSLDLKNYSIAGKYKLESNQLPYLITFAEHAKSILYIGDNQYQGNYTFEKGVLKFSLGVNEYMTFNIENETVTSYNGAHIEFNPLATYVLQKNPDANQFAGNTFNGSLKKIGENLLQVTKLRFNASQYGESSFGDPLINKDYTLINNLAAKSNTGANGTLTLYVIIDGKLEVGRKTQNAIFYGSLTKQ